jgi:uncharacterized membrane protein YqiK
MELVLIITLATLIVSALFARMTGMVRYIPNTRVGVVEKLFSNNRNRHGLIALQGETGFRPEVLRGGLHCFMPFQYRVHVVPMVTITQGGIGYLFARDGLTLRPDQTLASNLQATDFQDLRGFLAAGGQRGPQRQILREGTYALNLAQFVVLTGERLYYLPLSADDSAFIRMASVITERNGFSPLVIGESDDELGVVTIHDGPSLQGGDIIAATVGDDPADARTYHNLFQDPERFLAAGGRRGRQQQVLVEGTYYLNRLFATVERIPKTTVEVGQVGVVVSYTGTKGADLSGHEYSHGEMVESGKRGVWSSALLPGKYAFNTFGGQVMMVPTTNLILKWIKNQVGAHRLDENLAEVSLITKDAFEPSLPLSVVIHIDYRQAPLVIQRFGDIKRLVEQTLDPMVSAYFKNIGQNRTLIQLLQDRSLIQNQASQEMREKFARYNLQLEEVLIGTPTSSRGDGEIEVILNQLRTRQVASEQVETFARQQAAAAQERELREAVARASVQQKITESELSIAIQVNEGKAAYQRSLQQAAQIRTMAEAEADKVRLLGAGDASRIKALGGAEAERAARVGIAEAMAIEEQVRAYGGAQLQLTKQIMERFAQAIETSKVEIVPRVVVSSGAAGGAPGGGNAFESLLAALLSERLEMAESGPRDPQREATVQGLRSQLLTAMASPEVGSR